MTMYQGGGAGSAQFVGDSDRNGSSRKSYVGGKLSWGSRIAKEVTVQSMSGMDTEHAVTRNKLAQDDAIAYCREHEGGANKNCIANKLSEPISDEITADCETGEFSDFFGGRYKFLGKNRDLERMAQYLLKDLASGGC
jgi:hypothetical protein